MAKVIATEVIYGCYANGKQQFHHGLVCFRCNMKCLLMDKGVTRKNTFREGFVRFTW